MPLSPLSHAREPYQNLLDSAETWHQQGQYKEAVILTQTALELFTEKILRHLYRARRIEYLKSEFERLLINYNLGNSKVSGLYMALSGDQITQEPFWSQVIEHVELRNRLVHDGQDATQAESLRSLKAIQKLMNHVVAHNLS